MELVIDISNYDAEWINNAHSIPDEIRIKIADAIIEGTPLPEGHGRLIDADAYEAKMRKWYFDDHTVIRCTEIGLADAPTILEADLDES